jgi:hypothetical protein
VSPAVAKPALVEVTGLTRRMAWAVDDPVVVGGFPRSGLHA